jgi:hypothetical protein
MLKKNSILIIFAQWISSFGSKLHLLALPLIIYQNTNSAQLLALGFLAETLPWMILAPFLAIFLENKNSKYILIISDLIRALLCILLAFTNYNTIFFLLVMFLLGIFNSIYGNFRIKLLNKSINKDDISRLLSITNAGLETIQIVAPAFGGILLSLKISASSFLLFDSLSFLLSALILVNIHFQHSSEKVQSNNKAKIHLGFKSIYNSNEIFKLTVSEAVRSISEAFFIPILILVVKEAYKLNESYFGWAQTSMSIGALVMAILFSKLSTPFFKDKAPSLSLLSLGVLQLILLNGNSLSVLLLMLSLIGATMSFRQISAEFSLLNHINAENSGLIISCL